MFLCTAASSLIADLTGATPSVGVVHGLPARCADALGEVITLIKTLVTVAAVAHFDETTLRVGKAGVKKYVWSASTNRYTVFALGRRTGKQFRVFAVGTGFRGVAVHDRYTVYDTPGTFGLHPDGGLRRRGGAGRPRRDGEPVRDERGQGFPTVRRARRPPCDERCVHRVAVGPRRRRTAGRRRW
jgi:hypothetical protein